MVIAMAAILTVPLAGPAHARWGHELDLQVRTRSGWVTGDGPYGLSDDPSDLVITRSMRGDGKVAFTLRLVKRFDLLRPATIVACDGGAGVSMRFLYEGTDVTDAVTSGGYTTEPLAPSSHEIRVVATGRPTARDGLSCRMWAKAGAAVHDSLTLHVVR
jgi:hypothetical protein